MQAELLQRYDAQYVAIYQGKVVDHDPDKVALAPCVIGYAEIGQLLVADAATKIDGNPYRAWIETYSRETFLEAAGEAAQQLDRLAEARLGPGRFASLGTTFRQEKK